MDDVLAIVGPLLGSEAQAAATVAQQQSIPLIAVTRDDDISKKGDYIFHDFLNAESEVNALVDFAIKKKELKSFVIMYPNSEYGKQYSKMFAEKVEQNGAAVIENYMYEPNEVDFKDESCMVYYGTTDVDIKEPEIEGRQFDAVFIPDSYKRVSYIVPTLRYVGMSDKVQVLGTSRWNNPQLIDRTKDYVQGAVFTAGFHKESKEFLISKFVDTFKEAYSDDPTLLEAEGYDATRLIIKAIGNTGGKKRSSIKTDILKTVEYPGVTGMISVDSSGKIQKKVHLLGVVGDKIVPYNEMELLKNPIEIESETIELE